MIGRGTRKGFEIFEFDRSPRGRSEFFPSRFPRSRFLRSRFESLCRSRRFFRRGFLLHLRYGDPGFSGIPGNRRLDLLDLPVTE